MYTIRRLKDFESSIERLKHGGFSSSAKKKLEQIIDLLASGQKLPISCRDHKLNGELSEYRECHVKVNLLLVYKIEKGNLVLVLVDIGSHPYLF